MPSSNAVNSTGNPMLTGHVAKIQSYSTKDGPGVRTSVFMMGCNLRCLWCANPEMLETKPSMMYFKERCTGCGTCAKLAHQTFGAGNDCPIDRNILENVDEIVQGCPYDAYEKTGTMYGVDELVEKLLRDKAFYDVSGGGVTFSGGEAGLQWEFIKACCIKLKEAGVHVTLDTAGLIAWEHLAQLLEYVDLVLYDIKAYDHDIHKRCTGVDNTLILEHALKIAALPKDMYIRMIIVPGYNDDEADMHHRIEFVKRLGPAVKQVDILPYHILGVGKYHKLGMPYLLEQVKTLTDNEIERWKQEAQVIGCPITIGA